MADEQQTEVRGEPITLPESEGITNWSNDIEAAVMLAREVSPLMVMMLMATAETKNKKES